MFGDLAGRYAQHTALGRAYSSIRKAAQTHGILDNYALNFMAAAEALDGMDVVIRTWASRPEETNELTFNRFVRNYTNALQPIQDYINRMKSAPAPSAPTQLSVRLMPQMFTLPTAPMMGPILSMQTYGTVQEGDANVAYDLTEIESMRQAGQDQVKVASNPEIITQPEAGKVAVAPDPGWFDAVFGVLKAGLHETQQFRLQAAIQDALKKGQPIYVSQGTAQAASRYSPVSIAATVGLVAVGAVLVYLIAKSRKVA